jgi:hypothetical protein
MSGGGLYRRCPHRRQRQYMASSPTGEPRTKRWVKILQIRLIAVLCLGRSAMKVLSLCRHVNKSGTRRQRRPRAPSEHGETLALSPGYPQVAPRQHRGRPALCEVRTVREGGRRRLGGSGSRGGHWIARPQIIRPLPAHVPHPRRHRVPHHGPPAAATIDGWRLGGAVWACRGCSHGGWNSPTSWRG